MVHGATVQDISRIADGGDVSGGVVDFRLIRVLLAVHVSTTRNRFAVIHLTTLAAAVTDTKRWIEASCGLIAVLNRAAASAAVGFVEPACFSHLLTALLAAPSISPMLTAQALLLRRRVAALHGARLPSSVIYAQPA